MPAPQSTASSRSTASLIAASMAAPSTAPAVRGQITSEVEISTHDSSPPNTEPSPRMGDSDDPFDLPTKSDPNLRKLVEQELALHRKGRDPAR